MEATALPTPYQTRFRTSAHEGRADTQKDGTGGATGFRPHELLEAALASCMTITARMALTEHGHGTASVSVRVDLERTDTATRFRYAVDLGADVPEQVRAAVRERVAASPVLRTLAKPLSFVPRT